MKASIYVKNQNEPLFINKPNETPKVRQIALGKGEECWSPRHERFGIAGEVV